MFTRIFICTVLLAVFAQAQILPSIEQRKTRYGFNVEREPSITYQLFVYRTTQWKPILYLATSIQNDKLSFEKKDDHYQSRFRINIAIRHNKTMVTQNTWDEMATLNNFDATNSRLRSQYRSYCLPVFSKDWFGPREGKFKFFLQIHDLISDQIFHFNKEFNIKKSSDSASTEIAFLRKPSKGDSLFLNGSGEIIKFNYPTWAFLRFKNSKAKQLVFNIRIYQQNEKNGRKLIYQKFLTVKNDNGLFNVLFKMPYDSLDEGKYLLRFTNGNLEKEKKFQVVWFAKPTYLYKYDLAIRPMRYLLDEKTFKKIKHLSRDELKKWFKAYWKKRDPTPKTVYNELLAEFFRRVAYANRKFSTRHKEGWETDRGRVYILYGPPTKIDDHRYATETRPYQIWNYPDSLQFLFVDKNGNGEFNLVKVEK